MKNKSQKIINVKMNKLFIVLVLQIFLVSCIKKSDNQTITPPVLIDNYQCQTIPVLQFRAQNEITVLFDNTIIEKLSISAIPITNGAMSENKKGYFSVRFQIGVSNLADYVIDVPNTSTLEMLVKSIEYSFQYQLSNGDFQVIIPAGTNYPPPSEGDLASGNAFFMSSLGSALLALQESSFYNNPSNSSYKNRIEILRPKIQSALNFLVTKNSLLQDYDASAPNRLLFDALAFYSIGKWLDDNNGKNVGLNFVKIALTKRTDKGYFIEKGGWDSSYQGVGLSIGFKLLSIFDANETLKQPLWDCLSCGTNWLKSRILASGEISTQGNTRVYSGGEMFLGVSKTVAWKSTMIAFFNMKYLSGENNYGDLANKILTFYQN